MRALWGNPIPERGGRYHVFHDESPPNKRSLLIGPRLVQEAQLDHVRNVLQECRRQENYFGEIHFSWLPGSFVGARGPKARTARAWLQAYESGPLDKALFSALAIDRRSSAYDNKRFPRDFHAYNRFTAMALKAGIAWHLGQKNQEDVYITFVSDAKDRAMRPDRARADKFDKHLPYRAELDSHLSQIEGKNYPSISLDVRLE
ncbi:MAG: hypothetical protein ACUVTG_10840 [Candidatus Oleimicrobiaceae bacterium]